MDWLGSWIRSLIIIILLATCFEFLLPNNQMQRYVKTIVSLFILLMILSPILMFFQRDWDTDLWLQTIESKQSNMRTNNKLELDAILQEGDRLKSNHRTTAIEHVEQQLVQQITDELQPQTNYKVAHVEVKLDYQTDVPTLTGIHVTLQHIDHQTADNPRHNDDKVGYMVKSINLPKDIDLPQIIEISTTIEPLYDAASTHSFNTTHTRQPEVQLHELDQHPLVTSEQLQIEYQKLSLIISRDWQLNPAHIYFHFQESEK